MVSSAWKSGLLLGFGCFFVVTGAIMMIFWPPIFFGQLKQMMVLTNESMSYDMWRETPIPMYLECFMFNITNADEIIKGNGDIKPKVEQLGPYTFRETHTKVNITWNENNTVSYYNLRWWHFEPEMSNGSLSDVITSLNPIIITVTYLLRYRSLFLTFPVNEFLTWRYHNMFIKANVSDWLFDGINDSLLEIAQQFPNQFDVPYDRFGWFYERNGSETFDGEFLMNTGAGDFSQLGNIEKWRGRDHTHYDGDCGAVKGSSGELWAPEMGQPEITLFASDLCTYMYLAKDSEISVEGIEGVLYTSNSSTFDNGHQYPFMACYCNGDYSGDCLPPGALNVSVCRLGAPAFVSQPHFYNADSSYREKIDGLDPKPEHRFSVGLEMFTGMPLQVAAQLQINLFVRRIRGFNIINKLPPDTLMPMFWFRQEVRVSPEYAAMARRALNLRYGMMYGLYALTGVGTVLLMIGVFLLVRRLLKTPDTTPILQNNGESSGEGSN